MNIFNNKYRLATFAALVIHLTGLIGILFFDKEFFASLAPFHLLLMLLLIGYTQEKINREFVLFFIICFSVGMGAELIGTAGGLLFGEYAYSSLLGPAYKNVPFAAGLNWFIIIYCCGITINTMLEKLSARLAEMTGAPTQAIKVFSLVSDGAMLVVFFDWIIEPAAVKLGFWSWFGTGVIPMWNYLSCFIIGAVLMAVFSLLKFGKRNIFAVHLLLIMMMFFMLIRTFL
ncbi:MAG: carotenoid biosynthesis protein [Ferruginibacter sp.]